MSERKSFREKFGYDPGDYFENGKYNPLLLMSKIKVVGSRSGWETSVWWHNREEKIMQVSQFDKSLICEEKTAEMRAVCHNCSKICHPNFVTCLNVHKDQRDSEPRSRIIGGLHEKERSILRVPVADCGQGTFVNTQVPGNSRVGNCQFRSALAES